MNRLLRIGLLMVGMVAIAPFPALASGRIIEATGNVLLQRSDEQTYGPAAVGDILYRGDLVFPARQTVVTIRCSIDNTNWPVPAGVPSGLTVGCPSATRAFNTRGRAESDFLEFLNQRFVYATQVMGNEPVLRWRSVPEATSYVVQVEPYTPGATPGENIIWEHVSDRPSVRYQGPELNPGTDYQMIVSALVNQALQPIASLRFQRVDDGTATQIQDIESETEAQGLSTEAEAIVLADLYQSVAQPNTTPPDSSGLVYEAISVLEEAIADGSQTPYVHRLLGDLYLQTGLLDDAERRYQDVLQYAQVGRNGGDRAAAQVGLANIAAARGDRREAEAWLQRARVSYAASGDTQQLQQIADWISRIYF